MEGVSPAQLEGNRNMQDNFQHDGSENCAQPACSCSNPTSRSSPQPLLPQMRENPSRPQTQQRNRNRQECKVIKKDHGKQPGQRQFQQQRRETAQGDRWQQSFSRKPARGGAL